MLIIKCAKITDMLNTKVIKLLQQCTSLHEKEL